MLTPNSYKVFDTTDGGLENKPDFVSYHLLTDAVGFLAIFVVVLPDMLQQSNDFDLANNSNNIKISMNCVSRHKLCKRCRCTKVCIKI